MQFYYRMEGFHHAHHQYTHKRRGNSTIEWKVCAAECLKTSNFKFLQFYYRMEGATPRGGVPPESPSGAILL